MLLRNRWCGPNHRDGLRNSRAEWYPQQYIELLQVDGWIAAENRTRMLPNCRRRCNNQSGSWGSPKSKCNLQSHSNSNCWGDAWILRKCRDQPVPVLERVWTLIQCWFGWLLQKDQYWWALMSSQATIKTTINPYLEFFSYLRKGRKRSEDLRHRTCKKGQGICNNQPMQINLNITQLLSFCYVILNATKNYISI